MNKIIIWLARKIPSATGILSLFLLIWHIYLKDKIINKIINFIIQPINIITIILACLNLIIMLKDYIKAKRKEDK